MTHSSTLERTQWFADARYGFFFHFLNPHRTSSEQTDQDRPQPIGEWNEAVDSFDVDLFAGQLAELGAGYAFLTVGQNSGYYCSPNKTYDDILGENRCSRRDLISDFADALAKYHIPALVYTTGLAPYLDRLAVEKLECVPPWHTLSCNSYDRYTDLIGRDPRLTNFQRKWNAIHTEWSLRWSRKIKGWWVDGTYGEKMYRFPDPPNGYTFADALRAGNPESILAFNGGCVVEPSADCPEVEDYTAGEMNTPRFGTLPGPLVDGLRYHLLGFTGHAWWTGPVGISGAVMAEITRNVNDNGGVMTWDLPFSAEKGIDKEIFAALKDFAAEYRKSRKIFPKTSVAITPPRIAPDSSPVCGKVHLESESLAGTRITWNGQDHLCGEGVSSLDLDLPPAEPADVLGITRNGLTRRYPVTTCREFILSEKSSGPFEIFSDEPDRSLLASISLAVKDRKLVVEGTVFESEVVPPADGTKLCSSAACSNTVLFFSFDRKRKSEIYLRPDGHIFRIETMAVSEAENVEVAYTAPKDGKYSFRATVPFANLPGGGVDATSFRLNIAQHVFRGGRHVSGMLFGGENKKWAPSYDSAFFKIKP